MDLHDAAQRCADAADAAALDAFNRHVKLTRRVAVVHAATLRADPRHELTRDALAVVAQIAATGCVRHEWCRVKPVVLALLRNTLATFPEGPEGNAIGATPLPLPPVLGQQPVDVQWYIDALDSFGQHPPFTVQRLCELLLNPQQHYVRKHKLCHALEKLLMVTSCQPAGPAAAIMSDRAANTRAAAEASRQAAAAAAAALAAAAGVHSVAEGGGGVADAGAGVGPHPTDAGTQDGWDADMRVDAGMRPSERAEQQQDGKAAAHIASRAACGPDNNGVSGMSHVATGGSAQALHVGTAV